MPLINTDSANVLLIRQELANVMVSIAEIDIALQGLGVAVSSVVPSGTLDFSQSSQSDLIAVIAA